MTKRITVVTYLLLSVLIGMGIFFRFFGANWSQGANLHPDEYGLTNTITQLRIPSHISEYFNTRSSPLSPYERYDKAGTFLADGPDNAMRWGQWPIILIRFTAEMLGNTDYDQLRLTGRFLSALADSLSVLIIYLIGRRLFNRTVGLFAAGFSSLSVLPIQQSHFMTVDTFAGLFSLMAILAAVEISRQACVQRRLPQITQPPVHIPYEIRWQTLIWYIGFGAALGMALASRINLVPLAGIILIAGFISISDLRLKSKKEYHFILITWALFTAIAFVTTLLTFRLTQPMSFRQPVGDTNFFSFQLNPDWIRNLNLAQQESNGIGGGPPGEQWVNRPAVIFPWVNMVLWGMGLPLGLMAWIGFFWMSLNALRFANNWKTHLIPLMWGGGFFFFMATRWVKSMRYFLPVYPIFALFAAWAIARLWQRYYDRDEKKEELQDEKTGRKNRITLPLTASICVLLGTTLWAAVFVHTVYGSDHTRIQATRWIYENIPGGFHIGLVDQAGNLHHESIAAPDHLMLVPGQVYITPFTIQAESELSEIIIPHVFSQNGPAQLWIGLASDSEAKNLIDQVTIPIEAEQPNSRNMVRGSFQGATLHEGAEYFLSVKVTGPATAVISRTRIANESWDEGLPFPFDGRDPFGAYYHGLTMEVRWYDDDKKRDMFVSTLNQADYVILSSQRAIWSTCRIPRTYPMTMDYYRALFEGKLGFHLEKTFAAPFRMGPFVISDLSGEISLNTSPPLPIFNNHFLAAEEAFSVYDHPPVWIFKKGLDYDPVRVREFFDSINLKEVVVESPRDASLTPCLEDY